MPTKIFVGNIAPGTTSGQLNDLFRNYGPITECDVLGLGNYGFVHMANEADAETAITSLNGHILNGSEINVERSTKSTQGRGMRGGIRGGRGGVRTGMPRRNTTKLFIGNLKAGVTNEELRELFEPFGSVVEADVCGGFGFVHMANEVEALEAMNILNGFNIKGGCINIELSTKETQGRSSEVNRAATASAIVSAVTPSIRYETFSTSAAVQRPSLAVGFDGTTAYSFEIPTVVRSATLPIASPVGAMGIGVGTIGSVTTAGGDVFARDLLHLYTKDPEAFDRYAKEQLVRKSLDISAVAVAQPQATAIMPAVSLMPEEAFYRGGLMSVAPVSAAHTGAILSPDFFDARLLTRSLESGSFESAAATGFLPPANHLLGGIGYQTYASPAPVRTGPIAYASQLPTAWGGLAAGHHVYTTFE